MSNYEIVFPLNQQEKIIIQAEDPLEDIHCCYRVPTIFESNNKIYEISGCTVEDIADTLSKTLKNALANQLVLDVSITEDIGYLWNEAYRDKPGFVYEGAEGEVKLWVGEKFRIFLGGELHKEIQSTWIYNNQGGEIILEITPDYPWYECDPQDYENYIPYEEWIKSYKPLLIRTISKEVAKRWVQQADEIVNKIEENISNLDWS